MISKTSKKYAFFDFDLEYENSCLKKDKLSVCKANNIDICTNQIKPLNSFFEYFQNNFSEEEYLQIKNANPEIINTLAYVYCYSFFNKSNQQNIKRTFVLDSNLELYELDQKNYFFNKILFKFNSKPIIFENNLKLYFISDDNIALYFDGNSNPIFITDYSNLSCFKTYHENLIFSTKENPYSIFISTEKEIENISSNTELYNNLNLNPNYGLIISINIFNNYIYVLQEFGISKLSFNNQKVNIISFFPIASKILKESIYQVDDYLVFCTTNGLYLFDGGNLNEIFSDLKCMLPTKNIKSTVFNEKYYLVCNDIENNNGKNCILELNLLKNKVNFYEMNEIVDLYTIKCNDIYKLIVINKNNNLEILELGNQVNNNPKYVKFNKVLFDYASSKYLTEINIFSIGKYTLKITSDFEKKTIEVENNLSLRNLGISGNYFEFEILSEFEFCIQGIIVNIDFFTEKI